MTYKALGRARQEEWCGATVDNVYHGCRFGEKRHWSKAKSLVYAWSFSLTILSSDQLPQKYPLFPPSCHFASQLTKAHRHTWRCARTQLAVCFASAWRRASRSFLALASDTASAVALSLGFRLPLVECVLFFVTGLCRPCDCWPWARMLPRMPQYVRLSQLSPEQQHFLRRSTACT